MSAVVKRYGPKPERRFYQLDEELLRDGKIKPLPKCLLIDFFHRENKGEPVSAIGDRAKDLCVSYDTLERAEAWLVENGYLLKRERPGMVSVYLATYPAISKDDPDRAAYEADLERLFRDLPQNAGGGVPQNSGGGSRKNREVMPQNPGASVEHSYKDSKKNNLKTPPPPPAGEAADLSEDALELLAIQFFNQVHGAHLWRYHRTDASTQARKQYLQAFEGHLKRGHPLTPQAMGQAVDRALTSWETNGFRGAPRDAGPVINELAAIINPIEHDEVSHGETEYEPPRERRRDGGAGGSRRGSAPGRQVSAPPRDGRAAAALIREWTEEAD